MTYSHKVVQAAIVHPDKKQVFPIIEETLAQGDHFIFAAKLCDHLTLTNYLKTVIFERHDEVDQKGRIFVYEWYFNAPLNGREDALIHSKAKAMR